MLTMAPWDHGTPWAQLTMRRSLLLPLLLLVLCGQGAAAMDRGLRARSGARAEKEKEFNLTTISPDDETIDTLIDAVDSAVGTLQSAIDYSDYPQSFDNEEAQPDAFTGEGDYYQDPPPSISDYGADYEEVDEDEYDDYEYYDGNEEVDEYDDSDGEEEEEGEIVIEEATAGAEILNSTVSSSTIYAEREGVFDNLFHQLRFVSIFLPLMMSHAICPLSHPVFYFRFTTCRTSTQTLTPGSPSTSWTTMAARLSARCTRRRATSSTTGREVSSSPSCCRPSTWSTTGPTATAWSSRGRRRRTSR